MQSINQGAINVGKLDTTILSIASGVTIGGFSLCDKGGITAQFNDRRYSNKFLDNQYIDGKKLISHLIKEKNITVDFILKGSNRQELETLIDQLKTATSGQKTNGIVLFTVNVGSDTRILKVSVEDMTFNNDGIKGNVQSGSFTVVAVNPPRFYSKLATIKYYKDISSGFTGQINNLGNAINYPVYYFTFTSATGVDTLSWTINGYTVTVNETINNGDILVLSSDLYELIKPAGVYLNETAIDYQGQITTQINTGGNNVVFTCNGTYNIDITILYYNMRE